MAAPKKDKDRVAWNPRAHPLTRPPRLSYQNYTNSRKPGEVASPRSGVTSDTLSDVGTAVGGIFGSLTGQVAKTVQEGQAMELGWLRTSPTIKDTVDQPYGVVFHYNPTDVQMSMGVSSDLTLGSDPANATHSAMPLGTFGNSTVSLTLYLNRIFDMNGGPKDYPVALGSTPEGEDHWSMIRQLGTQWDVEFLLRAINPHPMKDALLPYKTADVGILPPGPVEIHLGPLAWRGIIMSVSVNHILFTPDFIPTFTTVDITLQRLVTVAQAASDGSDSTSDSTSTADADKKKKDAAAKVAQTKKAAAQKAAEAKKNSNLNVAKKVASGQTIVPHP